MESAFDEAQRILTPILLAAATGFIGWLFVQLKSWFGIKVSDANEDAIRRAAQTEAGVLIKADAIADPAKVAAAAAKIIADLPKQVTSEGYNQTDIKDMIIGVAATIFPPAALLRLLK